MSSDPRSQKIALVADALFTERLPRLRSEGWGVMLLPPAGLDPGTASDYLEQTAEQVAEYRRNGYEVVVLDDGAHGELLTAALERRGVPPLPPFELESE